MPIPKQEEFARPTLELAERSQEAITSKEVLAHIIQVFSLDFTDLEEKTTGGAPRVEKHVAWVIYLLRKANLLESVSRGKYQITQKGRDLLSSNKQAITQASLLMLANSETQPNEQVSETNMPPSVSSLTEEASLIAGVLPEDRIASGYQELQEALASDLLESVKSVSPARFEELVIALLGKMGYGAGQRLGRSGDGGIDGIITQDRLGFERVYVQAKRWTASLVGEPEIRNFSGSLDPHGATKGVFITTARFSETAQQTAELAKRNNKDIRLVDGPEMAGLMIEYDVGVVTKATLAIKELDENYFADA